jgi:hypothetical protein
MGRGPHARAALQHAFTMNEQHTPQTDDVNTHTALATQTLPCSCCIASPAAATYLVVKVHAGQHCDQLALLQLHQADGAAVWLHRRPRQGVGLRGLVGLAGQQAAHCRGHTHQLPTGPTLLTADNNSLWMHQQVGAGAKQSACNGCGPESSCGLTRWLSASPALSAETPNQDCFPSESPASRQPTTHPCPPPPPTAHEVEAARSQDCARR